MPASDEEIRQITRKVADANTNLYIAVAVLSSLVTAALCCGLFGVLWALAR